MAFFVVDMFAVGKKNSELFGSIGIASYATLAPTSSSAAAGLVAYSTRPPIIQGVGRTHPPRGVNTGDFFLVLSIAMMIY